MAIRTKIVCTMGPAVDSLDRITQLIEAGMNVARLNFSHGSHEEHARTIGLLKEARKRAGVPLAIMLDTKGPEIRLGNLREGQIHLREGDTFWLVKEVVEGDAERISLTPSHLLDALKKGMVVLLDNGYLTTHVIEVAKEGVRVVVDHGGEIRSKRGVNIPGIERELPFLTEKDIEDIQFGCREGIDLIAASFVHSAEQIIQIKKLLQEKGRPEIAVMAKIENHLGVEKIDEIIEASDGIMIARGDLGVELPLTQVPHLQKMMIHKCYLAGKPSITATQMLESMITHSRPTRAEASDVANAIYDSTSAVMLSAETAIGRYPIEVVKVMRALIEETELHVNFKEFLYSDTLLDDTPSCVAHASHKTAALAHARAIFAFSSSGLTARLLSRLRPEQLILAMTPSESVYHQLALEWGVVPILCGGLHNFEESYRQLAHYALEEGYVKRGDRVVITTGVPFGRPGTTNMMIVETIEKK